ncbi:glycosyltransferase family 2 protein, partial [Campylobacter jejuni]|nr:glycosyltransferase family 2 protein [Campylobacter jejuni]EAL7630400.1 glycosyltransferase family 2 protein [Campylobacter jejuni]ECL2570107.1 glycosyltransferase family 2 protein [Campylobacter jejuni]ECL2627606.1 glycosyltransferase family 2 protein [Campylobacter jejuni]ECL3440363.1 glycosyltransferase family 2 protein [Campylobacter jejuni]
MKTVGVVIPIYNVEKYLRECLDSVVNQTYKNLQVVLVNDGSTDENSLNIAKEYTLKDERFILFDKENGGQSTARNVGIEFFSKEYDFKNITQELKENSLVEFKLDNEDNPYNIYKIYKSSNFFKNKDELLNFKAPDIDYIIFLDSDDYWELNCIEECVPRMDGVEVVWFDSCSIFEEGFKKQWSSLLKLYDLHEGVIKSKVWLEYSINKKIYNFYFTWSGMIDFIYLKNIKLKFIDYIIHQDHHFGMLLFAKCKYIYIFPSSMHTYRIRSNSTINLSDSELQIHIPRYMQSIYDSFNINIKEAKEYYSSMSMFYVLKNCFNDKILMENRYNAYLLEKAFFKFICERCLRIFLLKRDPCCIKIQIKKILKQYKNYRYVHLTNFYGAFIYFKIF